jgi:hypothetical protein
MRWSNVRLLLLADCDDREAWYFGAMVAGYLPRMMNGSSNKCLCA